MKNIKIIIKLILVVLCMSVIFSFSADTGSKSTKKSDGFIIKTISLIKNRDLTKQEKESYTNYLVKPIRKGAHFIIYFILGLLVISLLNEFNLVNKELIVYAVLICFIYSCSDEIHQLFVAGRSGEVMDVILDTTAAITSTLLYVYIKEKLLLLKSKKV